MPKEPKGVVIHKDHVAFGLGLAVDNGQPAPHTAAPAGVVRAS